MSTGDSSSGDIGGDIGGRIGGDVGGDIGGRSSGRIGGDTGGRIDKDDIRAKFSEFKDSLDTTAEAARTPLLGAGVAVVVVLVVLAFLLGRRRGRAGRTVVEVRRV